MDINSGSATRIPQNSLNQIPGLYRYMPEEESKGNNSIFVMNPIPLAGHTPQCLAAFAHMQWLRMDQAMIWHLIHKYSH